MKGLILKDLLSLKKNMRTALLFLLFYVVFALMMHSVSFISGMAILFFTMLSVTSFAYDDQAGWNVYAASLPVTRDQIVRSKYVLALLLAGTGSVIALAVSFAAPLVGDTETLPEQLLTVLTLFLVSLLFAGVIIPLTYRFGVEKSRMMILVVFAVPALIGYLLSSAGVGMPDQASFEKIVWALPFAVLAFYYVSYRISSRIFIKKEL